MKADGGSQGNVLQYCNVTFVLPFTQLKSSHIRFQESDSSAHGVYVAQLLFPPEGSADRDIIPGISSIL